MVDLAASFVVMVFMFPQCSVDKCPRSGAIILGQVRCQMFNGAMNKEWKPGKWRDRDLSGRQAFIRIIMEFTFNMENINNRGLSSVVPKLP